MKRRSIRWLLGVGPGLLAVAAIVTPVSAAQPIVITGTDHLDGPALDCQSYELYGEWDISYELTYYFGPGGKLASVAEHLVKSGTFYNAVTGKSVADRLTEQAVVGVASDGSFLATIITFQRTDPYVHAAGQLVYGPADPVSGDRPLIRTVGHEGLTDGNIAALCTALAS